MSEGEIVQIIEEQKTLDISSQNKNKNEKLLKLTVEMVRASNELPKQGSGFELYGSYPDYLNLMKQLKLRMIIAMRKLSLSAGCKAKIPATGLEDMEKIMYANDFLVEKACTSFDKHNALLTQQFLVKQSTSLIGEKAAAVTGSIQSSTLCAKVESQSYYDAQLNAGTSKSWEGGPYANLAKKRVIDKTVSSEERMATIFGENKLESNSRTVADD